MIIYGLLVLLYEFIDFMLVFDIPAMPSEVYSYIDDMMEYIGAGAGVLANFVPLSYLVTLFGIVLAVDIGIGTYHFVMWVIRKIPMLGMS